MKNLSRYLPRALALCLFLIAALAARAQVTAFAYQGLLNDGSAPATGLYDLRFTLYDSSANGSLVSDSLTNAATPVTNGIFNATLNFGAAAFNGQPRWLEIAVRTNTSIDDFVPLNPRQQILSVPYAIMAGSASNLLGGVSVAQLPPTILTNGTSGVNLTGSFTGNAAGLTNLSPAALPATVPSLDSTNTFTQPVTLSGPAPALRIYGPGNVGAQATLDLSTYDPGSNKPSARIQTSDNNWSSDWDFYIKQPGANTNPLVSALHISTNGNIGLGVTSPQSKLTVAGDIQTGSNYVVAAQENLRIVRGEVRDDGSVLRGNGFSVITFPVVGDYELVFDPPFSDVPTVVASPFVSGFASFVVSRGLTTNRASIYTFDSKAVQSNQYFSFIAIGPK